MCVCVCVGKHYAISYDRLGHPGILASKGAAGVNASCTLVDNNVWELTMKPGSQLHFPYYTKEQMYLEHGVHNYEL